VEDDFYSFKVKSRAAQTRRTFDRMPGSPQLDKSFALPSEYARIVPLDYSQNDTG
jgi:hypothetical protein